MTALIEEHDVTVHLGDAAAVLREQPPGSVNCIVTSPPYYGLRDYGVDGQLGLEDSPAEYVASLIAVFDAARAALADDGVLWLNLGDSYSTGDVHLTNAPNLNREGGRDLKADAMSAAMGNRRRVPPMPLGNLMMVPARAAIAMQEAGWILRKDVIWHKPNAMPESVPDRPSSKHEHLFLFAKSRKYWFDLGPIREQVVSTRLAALTWDRDTEKSEKPGQRRQHRPGRIFGNAQNNTPRHAVATDNTGWKDHEPEAHPNGRNPGDVWSIPTSPFPGAHFACMPPELARRCILAGCPEGGTVYDPFTGSGTTAMVARSLGRKFVGSELNPDYFEIIRDRIGPTPFEFSPAVGGIPT